MKQFTRRVRRYRRAFFNSQTLVAAIGLILSVALHELFHVAMHWNTIINIELFPDHAAIMAITSNTPSGYDVHYEELVAYGITLVTMLVTIAVICAIRDRKDTRSFAETVFPRDEQMQQLNAHELYELAVRAKLV